LDRAAEAVELPDDQGVTSAQVVQRRGEARAVADGLAGADLLLVGPPAPGARERVTLELGVLAVRGDPGQADESPVTAGQVGDGVGGGSGGGLCHAPNVAEPSQNF